MMPTGCWDVHVKLQGVGAAAQLLGGIWRKEHEQERRVQGVDGCSFWRLIRQKERNLQQQNGQRRMQEVAAALLERTVLMHADATRCTNSKEQPLP